MCVLDDGGLLRSDHQQKIAKRLWGSVCMLKLCASPFVTESMGQGIIAAASVTAIIVARLRGVIVCVIYMYLSHFNAKYQLMVSNL